MNDAETKVWPVAIIGAGAAGLMAAITARRAGAEVLLLDGKEKIGAKILMSGGTRCNITNERVETRDFESSAPQVVASILSQYTSENARNFFHSLDLKLVCEDGGKYFPRTHSGRTVLEAFLKEVERLHITLLRSVKVTALSFKSASFQIEAEHQTWRAKKVILTTGGLSFPATGSDGSGYALARTFGHRLVDTSPSLTPLDTDDEAWQALSGVSLPMRISFWSQGKKRKSYEGSFLFTHFGFSGPVVLNLSRHWIRSKKTSAEKVVLNFLPELPEEVLRSRLTERVTHNPNETFLSFLSGLVPMRVAETLLKKGGIQLSVTLNQLPRPAREALIRSLYHTPLSISGDRGYAKAEVTAGGISLREINPRTLESSKQAGLYFAGEILDVDGRIGGFNFQWAWASGYLAGRHAAC